jgi:hypothetical protein
MPTYEKTLPELKAIVNAKRESSEDTSVIVLGKDDLTDPMKFALGQYTKGSRAIIVIDLMPKTRFEHIVENGLTDTDWVKLKSMGVTLVTDSVDIYADVVSVYDKDGDGNDKAFNLGMVVDLNSQKIEFSFGELYCKDFEDFINFDYKIGMDINVEVLDAIDALEERNFSLPSHEEKARERNNKFLKNLSHYSDAYDNIITAASALSKWLKEEV